MHTDWSSREYELTELLVLETAIRSSPYLQYLATGVNLSDEANAEFRDLIASEIEERLDDEAAPLETYTGLGGYGDEFFIIVMSWGGIYFVEAPEFPRLGYYLSLEDARAHALHIAECFPVTGADDVGEAYGPLG
jgi:hypothetical protein